MASTPNRPSNDEHPSTYMVQDRQNKEELERLIIQDQLVTTAMGGVLPEQADPARFRRVLDVGCGPGGWLLETAQTYPSIQLLIGIDISQRMVNAARGHAATAGCTSRVQFYSMDALRMLEFPTHYFDLVNLRFGVSFLRTWEWSKMMGELQRVTYPGGVIRITDAPVGAPNTSPALTQWLELFQHSLYRAGHLFTDSPTGLVDALGDLLIRHGCQQVQTKTYTLPYPAGSPQVQLFIQDMEHLFHTTRPFIEKWSRLHDPYQSLSQQALEELHAPTFEATGELRTVWGSRSLTDGARRRRD